MSVIAWDGNCLSADKRISFGTLTRTVTKIFRVNTADHVVVLAGYAGDVDVGEEVLAWFKDGRDPAKYPTMQRANDTWVGLLIIWPDRTLWKYERTPYPIKLPPQQFAMGSGRDFALAAMHCGKNAAQAVEVACLFDNGCGNGIDTMYLDRVAISDDPV